MKNKRKFQNVYSGIKITDNISLTLPKRKFLPGFIPLILIALSGCIGTVNSFVSMFSIDISTPVLNFYTVFFFAVFSAVFILPKNSSAVLIPVLLIYEFLIYRKWEHYLNGFMLVYNQTYKTIFPRRSDYFRLDMSEIDPESDVKIFICFTLFILTALICYFSIVKPNFLFGFILTFPFVEIGLYYGKSPDLLPVLILVVYWSALLTVHHSGYSRNSRRSKTGFIRNGTVFTAKPSVRYKTAGQSGIIMLLTSSAIMTAAFLFINLSGYSRSEQLNQMRRNVKTAVSEFSFEDIGGSLEKLSASFGIGNLKSYDRRLGNLNSVSYTGKTDLTITAEKSPLPLGDIYLKGYVGSVYDGKSWEELDSKIYGKNSDLFDSFEKDGVYPQDMLFYGFGRELSLISGASLLDITVEPSFFNQKYFYTPYNCQLTFGEVNYIDDTRTEMKDSKKYSFSVSPYQDYDFLLNDTEYYNNKDYSQYRDFVYKNYLDVPNNDDTEKLYDLFIDGHTGNSTYSQLKYIKNVLAKNAQYTLEPGITPSDRDFVNYFLTENHKGYCVHFATAGIILARMSGIPARYAEGYVLLKDDFSDENKTDNGYKIGVKDERAHAWAEIYIDGCGWIPYEFTPGSAAALNNQNTTKPETTKPVTETTVSSTTVSRTSHTTVSSSKTTLKHSIITKTTHSKPQNKSSIKSTVTELSPEIKLILATILSLLLITIIIAAVHCIVLKKRENSFKTSDNSLNALNAYGYIIKLLEFCDVKNNNMQYLEFAEFAEQKIPHLFRTGELTDITSIALEAAMSRNEIAPSDAEKVIRLAHKTAHAVFRRQNIFGRFYMKFIRNLL